MWRRLARRLFYFSRHSVIEVFNTFLSSKLRLITLEIIRPTVLRDFWGWITPVQHNLQLRLIGGAGDGSYYVPAEIMACLSFVVSPGYGGVKRFEDEISDFGIPSIILDGNYTEPNDLKSNQKFINSFLSKSTDQFLNSISLSDLLDKEKAFFKGKGLLQIDIEGEEWEIFSTIRRDTLRSFFVICVEFHELDRLIFDLAFSKRVAKTISTLSMDFSCVHSRENPFGGYTRFGKSKLPKVVEVTLVQNDLLHKMSESRAGSESANCASLRARIAAEGIEKTLSRHLESGVNRFTNWK